MAFHIHTPSSFAMRRGRSGQKAIVPGTMAPVTGAVSVDIAFFLPGCGILPTASASSQNHVRYTPCPAFRHAVRGPRLTEAGHERQRTSPRNTGDPARATEARSRENSIRSHSLAKLAATSVLPRARDLRRQIAPMNEAAAKSGPGRVCGEQETIRVGLQGPRTSRHLLLLDGAANGHFSGWFLPRTMAPLSASSPDGKRKKK